MDVEEVIIGRNAEGRPSGEAFVRLASKDDVHQALKKNKEHMGKRWDMYHSYFGFLLLHFRIYSLQLQYLIQYCIEHIESVMNTYRLMVEIKWEKVRAAENRGSPWVSVL